MAYKPVLCYLWYLFTVPVAVQAMTSDASFQNELSLSWKALIGCSPDGYQVEYELTNSDQCHEIQDPERVMWGYVVLKSVVVSELMPYSTYAVHITANNSVGYGARQNISDITKGASKYISY